MSGNALNDVAGDASTDRTSGPAPSQTAVKRQALELFRGLPGRYDRLSAALSFGQDPRWRRALVSEVAPSSGDRVLDVATGTGMVAAELLARSDCLVVGIDQSPEMLSAARARFAGRAPEDRSPSAGRDPAARAPRSARVELVEGQAEALPFADASFDALTFTYLLRYVEDPRATIRELARVVRPGGRVASLEFGVPPWAPARAAWRLYTAVGLPTLGRIFSREWGEVGRFLGPSIAGFYKRHPVERIVEYWQNAGLQGVNLKRMSLGGGIVMSATRSGGQASSSDPAGA
jgi:demethylmenaquinone methyltransferase/2-methoxy-6-polyprenyl-1,4-benzoquinol methylase